MSAAVLLITPPFTQLNTPYPATAYLKGFLNTRGIASAQCDLGLDTTLSIFSERGLQRLFGQVGMGCPELSGNARRILSLRDAYLLTIDSVIRFLQGKDPALAHTICQRSLLPEASRFAQAADLNWAFGAMGTQDRAKHLATLYLEDLADLVRECADPLFGFSRYAERLGRSANSFDELYGALNEPPTFTDDFMLPLLEQYIQVHNPALVALSVPFPGNLYSALRCGQYLKARHPGIRVAMGGGFPNTELRSLTDARVFEFLDYITLDDGEAPLEQLIGHIAGQIPATALKRTFCLQEGRVIYMDNPACGDYRQASVGTPDYSGLPLDGYISAIEVTNPMHSLWSDGRWNKLTMAHGCYWSKCTFCDITLDYIKNYEPLAASVLCDRVETLIAQTGQSGFHFVDEAAPPALMRAFALEIIRRKIVISWWTNIRFEKSFTRGLCQLLRASGCIAVSGGLEVASDRLLALICKGVTVAQVALVNKNFTEAGIMVHAYLMYGFPGQTAQETIDSLEMVRQMFAAGILRSGHWHRFAMTAHSPVGNDPEKYGVVKETLETGTFANNDILFHDPKGADHELYSDGLRKSLHNYMLGACLDFPLQKWFEVKVPKTRIAPGHITGLLEQDAYEAANAYTRYVWLGAPPALAITTRSKKGEQWQVAELTFTGKTDALVIKLEVKQGQWLLELLPELKPDRPKPMTRQQLTDRYYAAGLEDFDLFWDNKPVNGLWKMGLLAL